MLKTFAGAYAIAPLASGQPSTLGVDTLTISADTAGLLVAMGPKRRFLPASTTRFCDREVYAMCMTFTKDDGGVVTGLALIEPGPAPAIHAKRVR